MTTEELFFILDKIDVDWIDDNPYETMMIIDEFSKYRMIIERNDFDNKLNKELGRENQHWKEEALYWENKYKRMKEDEVHNAE